MSDIERIYSPAHSRWERQNSLCKAGKLTELRALVDSEERPSEKEILYTSTFHLLLEHHRESAALRWAKIYLTNFEKAPTPFGAPLGGSFVAMVCKLYEGIGEFERAIALCDFALGQGIREDGTKGGLAARRSRLVKRIAVLDAPQKP